jgi:molybdopterin-guanine dinucleotide biosynthesis protein A
MAPADQLPDFDTVILAGGRAVRMHGADKPGLDVGGQPMLVRVARAAVAAGTKHLIIVGPERGGAVGAGLAEVAAGAPVGLTTVREDPPGAGPVPALRCGLAVVTAPWVALLAADLPFLTGQWLTALRTVAVSGGLAGAMLADDNDRPQWLVGCWQTGRLAQALTDYQGDSLGGLLRPLHASTLRASTLRASTLRASTPRADGLGVVAAGSDAQIALTGRPPWQDCDSPADLAAARAACPLREASEAQNGVSDPGL